MLRTLFLFFPVVAQASEAASPGVSAGTYLQAGFALILIVGLLAATAWMARKVSGGKGFGQAGLKVIGGVALGRDITREELLALREKHPSSVYFSRELMAKYFTYSAGNGTHFVLFDDAETLRQKVKLAQNLGIQTAFLMFPEISDLLPEL